MGQLTAPGTALTNSDGTASLIGSPKQVLDKYQGNVRNRTLDLLDDKTPSSPQMNIGKPSFKEAATTGATPGGVNATSPGLTKAGKLVALLTSGLQGALAGRAASENAVIQSGGRRSGGAGMGFEAGYTLPWQRLGQQLGLQQQAANVQATQAQNATVQTPQGPMPAWLARYIAPSIIRGQAEMGAAQTRAGAEIQKEQIGQRFKIVPNVGLYDTQANNGQGQIVSGTQQGITVTPEIAKDYQLPQEFIGKPMSLSNLAAVQRSSVFENVPEMTAQGPIIVNRRNAAATPVVGPGGQRYGPTGLAMPREIADPNNPGQTLIVPAGQSFGQAGPQSASVQVPRAAARAEVPTKIGDQKVAFDTMLQHADLLRNAAKALNNNDVQTLNGLQNAWINAFGDPRPITAQTIADAYGGEVTNVIAKGHITDKEIEKTGKTIDPNRQNFEQISNVLDAYKNLAQSKMNMLNKQEQTAIQKSQPKPKAATQAIELERGPDGKLRPKNK